MSKTLNIIFLSIIIILLTLIMIVLLVGEDKYFDLIRYNNKIVFEEEYEVGNIDNFNMESLSTDIILKKSENDKIKVIVYGIKKDYISTKINDDILYIKSDNKRNICIGFCFENRKMEIYVPIKNYNKFDIVTKSGDVRLSEFNLNDVSIETTSGDIVFDKAINADLRTKSGNITFTNLNIGNTQTISGDIKGNIVSDITASTVSGEIYIKEIKNLANIKSTSGDIKINNLNITNYSSLTTVSGNIKISKTNDIYINTSTISGNINVNQNNRFAKNELSITTVSGNIEVLTEKR